MLQITFTVENPNKKNDVETTRQSLPRATTLLSFRCGLDFTSTVRVNKQTILKSYFEKDQKQLGWFGECEGIFSETARKRICSPSSRHFVSSAEEDF